MDAPTAARAAFRNFILAGTKSPGVIPRGGIDGFDLETDWQVKKGKGADDATMTDGGDNPPTGTIRIVLWRDGTNPGEPDDFADWTAFYQMLRAARKAKAALDILHPVVNSVEVTSVVVKKISPPKEVGPGKWEAAVTLQKWVPEPKPAGGTPGGSAAGKGTADGNAPGEGSQAPSEDAQTDAEKELEQLADEAGF